MFYLIAFRCLGQIEKSVTENNLKNSENYIAYYQQIAEAEKAIVFKHYKEAIQIYSSTFQNYSYNNPIDCYVAAQIAAFYRDTLSTKIFLFKAISFGVPIATIENNSHLKAFYHLLKLKSIDFCKIEYKNRINNEARKLIISLSKCDQNFIQGKHIYNKSGFKLKEQYQPFWDSLVYKLQKIIEKYGFPAHRIIGTQSENDTFFRVNPHSNYAYFILIHHCDSWKILGNLLIAELKKGNITPQMYAAIYEYSNGVAPDSLPIQYCSLRPCQDKKCWQKLNLYGIAKIDENRKKIGLCDLDVMKQKFELNRKYYDWARKEFKDNLPYFDFKCDLNFFQN